MATKNDYDIMIVGGGPAGISTWLHLNKFAPELASRTVLIEKEKYPREKLCGGALGGWTIDVLNELNFQINVPSVEIHNVKCIFREDIYEHKEKNFFKIIRRLEFDHSLAKAAIERGMQLHQNEKFLEIKRTGKYLTIRTNEGKYKTNVLVGADGALSMVRQQMKTNTKPHLAPTLEIFAPANEKYDFEFYNNTVTIDFSPIFQDIQGYLWHFPCIIDGRAYMNHGIGNFRIHSTKPQASLKDIFSKVLRSRNINYQIEKWKSHPISCLTEENIISKPNIILVGDAAGIDPAIGGGIHLALSYGELAAQTINKAFNQNDFSFNDYREQLKNHIVGKYIHKLTYLANEMYINKMNPLDVAKEIFSKKRK